MTDDAVYGLQLGDDNEMLQKLHAKVCENLQKLVKVISITFESCSQSRRSSCVIVTSLVTSRIHGPSQSSPSVQCGPFAKGVKPPIRTTTPHLAPDHWIRSGTTQHWSGNWAYTIDKHGARS